MPSRSSTSGSSSNTAGDEGDAVAVAGRLDAAGRLGARVGIAVQADQPQAGVGVEHRQRVAGEAEGGVDEDGAVGGAGRGEEFGDAFEQDGHVHRGPRGLAAAHRHCLSNGPGVLRRWSRASAPCGGTRAAGDADRFRWGRSVGRGAEVERSGRGGARWGMWGAVGRGSGGSGGPPPTGLRLASGKSVRWCPVGAVGCRRSRPIGLRRRFGTEPRGRRLGPGPVEPRGRRLVRRLRTPVSAGGGVPWDHDSVGIPSLSMSA